MVTATLFPRIVPEDVNDIPALKHGFLVFNSTLLAITGFSAIATLFLFRTRAPTPPSPETQSRNVPFTTSVYSCLSNWRFVFTMIAFGVVGPWLWDMGMLTVGILDAAPGYTASEGTNLATAMTAGMVYFSHQ